MTEEYESPISALENEVINNSGLGREDIDFPDGIKGWSWGAFILGWVWAIGNRTWVGLLVLIPYVGPIFSIILGIKGREWAWQNKRWDSIEHFNDVQAKWSFWSLVILVWGAVIFALYLDGL
ncbi:MAG: hypothetical protein KUG73_11355 [Pseudomonadales bacterium]|nr:hypothetical protein [Pseudomonadales bacterium]